MLGLGNVLVSPISDSPIIANRVSFSNTKSLFTDGVDDYFEINLASDIVDHGSGTVSFWVNVDSGLSATAFCFEIFDDSQKSAGRIGTRFFKTSSTVWSLDGFYRDETSTGVYSGRACQAKTGSSHHGKPHSRVASDYGAFGSAAPTYDADLSFGNWHHIAFTWDSSLDYTYKFTTHNGSLKLYFDGVLVNHGASTIPSNGARGTATGINSFASTTVLDKLRIGANNSASTPIDALTDEFALFGAALSDSDISDIYNSGAPGDLSSYSDLIGWWRFEDDTNDSSSNSNSGTLTNGATYNSGIPS